MQSTRKMKRRRRRFIVIIISILQGENGERTILYNAYVRIYICVCADTRVRIIARRRRRI